MEFDIGSERVGDEDGIDQTVCSAFGSMCEAHIVRLMRQHHPAFDRRFSVVARDDGRIIGHVLFTPARIRLMGRTVNALAVGPVATVPDRQKQGIAAEMMRYGHDLGRESGYELCFLYGHPGYYPRLGYRACFGFGQVTIDQEKLPEPTMKFRVRPVGDEDVLWIAERHAMELRDVDFGWSWGSDLREWNLAPMNNVIWQTQDGRRVAYTVATPGRNWNGPGKCDLLLADDPAMAREVLATIRPKTMPHHPSGWLARSVLDKAWSTVQATRSDAAMAYELQPGALDEYMSALEAGRPPGAVQFPLAFLAC